MVEKFDPLVVLASIHKERCTALYGVPTMFIAELNHPMFPMFDLTSLRTGIMAGSLCPVELMRQVEEKMFMRVTSVYGLTEIHISPCTPTGHSSPVSGSITRTSVNSKSRPTVL